MVIVTLNTRNFEFAAVGRDKAHALQALREGWMEHVNQTGANADLVDIAIEDGEYDLIDTDVVRPGMCARDGSVISV